MSAGPGVSEEATLGSEKKNANRTERLRGGTCRIIAIVTLLSFFYGGAGDHSVKSAGNSILIMIIRVSDDRFQY